MLHISKELLDCRQISLKPSAKGPSSLRPPRSFRSTGAVQSTSKASEAKKVGSFSSPKLHSRFSQCQRMMCQASDSNGKNSQEYVDLANKLADATGEILRKYFRTKIGVDAKADESPVTKADREAEAKMREILREEVPDHGIFGEEEGMNTQDSESEYLWVLDPIDGTRQFITGKPLFGTLIALLHKGKPILGIIDQPILKERWVGIDGSATTFNGEEIKVRQCKDIRQAYSYSTSPHLFVDDTEEAFLRVRNEVLQPLYGCDCYAYGLLASGFCDIVIEADMKPYDYMAHVPIVKGAGGKITDWQGQELVWPILPSNTYSLEDLPGEVLAAGDEIVHKKALELLGWQGGGTYNQAQENLDIDSNPIETT